MSDCMVMQKCIEVVINYNVSSANSTSTTLIWAGSYFDSVDNVATLALLPDSVKVWPHATLGRGNAGGGHAHVME